MASGININPTVGSLLSSLVGGSGALGQAANQIWQNGQFMPYNLQLPGSTLNFNGNTATGGLSSTQQGVQNSYLSQLSGAMAGANYNPTASLTGALSNFQNNVGGAPNLTQYGNVNTAGNAMVNAGTGLLGSIPNFNSALQSNYQSLANSQMPYLQQANASNLDNQFAKGTLASTAGAYQTMGQQQANANILNQDYSTAFGNALNQQNSAYQNASALGSAGSNINLQQGGLLGNLASTQFGQNLQAQQALFGAAGSAANLQEQQSEFGSQFNQNQATQAFSNIMNQNQAVANQVQTGGNLGQQQSTANTNASMPFLQAGQTALQGQSGLLNSLLFGNGSSSGGLLSSLLGGSGTGGSSGGLLGNIGSGLANLLGGGTGVNSSNTNGSLTLGNMTNPYTDPYSDPTQLQNQYSNDYGNNLITGGSDLGSLNFGNDQSQLDGSFSSAGGQAANQGILSSQEAQNPQLAGLSTDQGSALNSAGGTNANFNLPSTGGSLAGGLGAGIGALNLYNGLQSGTPGGYLQAASGANKLLSAAGANTGSAGQAIGAAGNAMGIYNGIQRGGVSGYGSAAVNAGQLAESAGLISSTSTVGQAIPVVGAALSVYNFAQNWQSGNTGSDAANGAEAGAAIGSIVPGIGTAIGAVIGGAVGALSSLAGPGKTDAETAGVQNVINATSANGNNPGVAASVKDPYLSLAGLFDEKSSTLPIYQQYGRMGEQSFTNAMVQKINTAITQNPSLKNNPSAVYSQVVQPWVQGMGNWNNVGQTYQATVNGTLQDMTNEYLGGMAATDWTAIGGDSPFANVYNGTGITNVGQEIETAQANAQVNREAGGVGNKSTEKV